MLSVNTNLIYQENAQRKLIDKPVSYETTPAIVQLILLEIERNFEEQLKFLSDFVQIPSLRFEEAPAQDFMSEALRNRDYEVDDWLIKI